MRRQQLVGRNGAQDNHYYDGRLVPPPTIVSRMSSNTATTTDTGSSDSTTTSYDDDSYSYADEGPSPNGKHINNNKHKKKKHYGGRRSLLDHVRLCFVTGRLSRWIVHTTWMVVVGAVSFWVGRYCLRLLWPSGIVLVPFSSLDSITTTSSTDPDYLVLQQAGYAPKPAMVGCFWNGVDSPRSFTHRIQRLTPPHHYEEWVQMLQQRLEHMVQEDIADDDDNDDDDDEDQPLLLPLRYPMSQHQRQHEIETASAYYADEKPDITPNPEQCTPQYDWQTNNPVVCNIVHEHTMALDRLNWHPHHGHHLPGHHHHHHQHHHHNDHHDQTDSSNSLLRRRRLQETSGVLVASNVPEHFRLLAHGYWRETWMMQGSTTDQEMVAFKTLRYHHDTTEYVLDKQRRDAVTSDRITGSQQSIHMYAYCGTSALYEYAPGGDLEKLLDRFDTTDNTDDNNDNNDSPRFVDYYSIEERFLLAYNATAALTDLHTTEGADHPTGIVHGDFKADQFVAVTPAVVDFSSSTTPHHNTHHKLPHFKLGDYNLARMVYWNKRGHHPCVIEPDGNGGTFRAPEEYAVEHGRTEKVDIYSLGNLLYTILTGHWPFDDVEDVKGMPSVRDLVKAGHRPHINIDSNIRNSKSPQVQALITAIDMCWKQDPHERASAQEVLDVLEAELF